MPSSPHSGRMDVPGNAAPRDDSRGWLGNTSIFFTSLTITHTVHTLDPFIKKRRQFLEFYCVSSFLLTSRFFLLCLNEGVYSLLPLGFLDCSKSSVWWHIYMGVNPGGAGGHVPSLFANKCNLLFFSATFWQFSVNVPPAPSTFQNAHEIGHADFVSGPLL